MTWPGPKGEIRFELGVGLGVRGQNVPSAIFLA